MTISRLPSQCDAEARLLDSSANWPDQNSIERPILHQYERLEEENTAAGSQVFVTTDSGSDESPFLLCLLFQARARPKILPQMSSDCPPPRRRNKLQSLTRQFHRAEQRCRPQDTQPGMFFFAEVHTRPRASESPQECRREKAISEA